MTDHERGIEAATKAWMDDRGIDDRFDHWRGSLEIAISAYLATIEPGKPESGVLAEAPCEPYRWIWEEDLIKSGTWDDMYDDEPPSPHDRVRNVRPLYLHPIGVDIEAHQRRVEELEAAAKPFVYNSVSVQESTKLIQKSCGDMVPVSLSVTKAQFLALRSLIQEQKKDG
jgi:hypothetical protein